jgi:hypothetical protein
MILKNFKYFLTGHYLLKFSEERFYHARAKVQINVPTLINYRKNVLTFRK